MKPIKELLIRCLCSCGVLALYDFGDGELNIVLYKNNFHVNTWRGRFRAAWAAIKGELFTDNVILDKESIKKLSDYLHNDELNQSINELADVDVVLNVKALDFWRGRNAKINALIRLAGKLDSRQIEINKMIEEETLIGIKLKNLCKEL